jgi:hypothetical protein
MWISAAASLPSIPCAPTLVGNVPAATMGGGRTPAPANAIEAELRRPLSATGPGASPKPGGLGLSLHMQEDGGCVVVSVDRVSSGGAADSAGLRVGDLLTCIAGVDVRASTAPHSQLRAALLHAATLSPGDAVLCTVLRPQPSSLSASATAPAASASPPAGPKPTPLPQRRGTAQPLPPGGSDAEHSLLLRPYSERQWKLAATAIQRIQRGRRARKALLDPSSATGLQRAVAAELALRARELRARSEQVASLEAIIRRQQQAMAEREKGPAAGLAEAEVEAPVHSISPRMASAQRRRAGNAATTVQRIQRGRSQRRQATAATPPPPPTTTTIGGISTGGPPPLPSSRSGRARGQHVPHGEAAAAAAVAVAVAPEPKPEPEPQEEEERELRLARAQGRHHAAAATTIQAAMRGRRARRAVADHLEGEGGAVRGCSALPLLCVPRLTAWGD